MRDRPVFSCLAVLCLALVGVAASQVAVTTNHNDSGRTGTNLQESVLNTSNVNVSNFGKLFTRTVDGYIYAQPLYVPNLTIGGKLRNVVYVATEHDSVYAFDGDDPSASSPLWHVTLGTSVPSQDVCTSPWPGCPYNDLVPEIGITATPVVDTAGGTIYVVAKTKTTRVNKAYYHFKLHALDLLTGKEKFGGPVEITASGFNPLYHLNRPGLLLLNGMLYIGFGSVGDINSWHGWVLGYNSSTLQKVAVFNSTPGGKGGALWAGGQGLAADVDNIYAMSANGTFDASSGGRDYGDSVLKLSTSSGLSLADYFTPDNQSFLNGHDVDLGSGGPLLLPGTNLLVGIGKDGIARLIDTANMGRFNALIDNDVQEFTAVTESCGGASGVCFMGAPVYWDSPGFGPAIYLWGSGDYLKAFQFNGANFQTTPASQGSILDAKGLSNTASLSVSANGSQAGTGIVWASAPYSGDANDAGAVPGILYAFDGSDLSHELWDSKQDAARDDVGNYAKFCPPTIANGKVYVATFSGQLVVYGLNPPPPSGIRFIQVAAATPQSPTATVSVTYPSAESPGDLNVVVVGWNDTSSSVQSVTDSHGNTYTLAAGPVRGTNLSQSIYYLPKVSSGSNTVTVTFNQAATYPDIRILEYSGVSSLDVVAGLTGNSAMASSGPATTTFANELIFGANTVYTGDKGAGSGFTSRIITSPDGDIAEDMLVNATGTYTATAPLVSSGNWVMQMATFK